MKFGNFRQAVGTMYIHVYYNLAIQLPLINYYSIQSSYTILYNIIIRWSNIVNGIGDYCKVCCPY